MNEKVSTITLRLTAEEAEQLEALKSLTGKRSASEAIKYIVREYPRFCAHYKQEAREHGELKRKYQEQGEAVRGFLSALDRLEKVGKGQERGK
ncbi:MAG: ribbon-helix-helix protein, CopG family [Bacteroides ovatus]|mgnify:CR=1 FL=1|uniref:ribbon-helix-helix protein, CopG family n=1 Tax=Bacteroides sp. TaxID=29523 RepID=UPI003AB584A8|nr:ribbon-helix-helix protein, CopG family [Bacteroides ovatus]